MIMAAAKLIEFVSFKTLVKTSIVLVLLEVVIAYPASNYRLPVYEPKREEPNRLAYESTYNSPNSWAFAGKESNQEYTYNFENEDMWNYLEENRPGRDYDNSWLEDENIMDKQQELLNLYYLVESLEKQTENERLTADTNSRADDDLPNQLMEVSNKRKVDEMTTTRPDAATVPATKITTEAPTTKSTSKSSVKKGQKEAMMMRPASPVKHPFAQSLEKQLSSTKPTKTQKNYAPLKQWSFDVNKLKEQLKMLKENLKQ